MIAWLDKNHWRYVVDSHGFPKVAYAYYEKKMGISENKIEARYEQEPDFSGFKKAAA